MRRKRRIAFRWVLALMGLAIVLPLVAVGAVTVAGAWRQQLGNIDGQNIEIARAISIAVDEQVESTLAAMQVIATVEDFDNSRDTTWLQELARRLLARQPAWHAILLADSTGRIVMNTAAIDRVSPMGDAPDWARQVVRTRQNAISNMIERPTIHGHFVVAAVPVVRRGALVYVLGVESRTDALSAILQQQQVPPNGVVTLLDRTHHILARTLSEDRYLGKDPSPGFLAAVSRMREGAWKGQLLEGTPAYAALSTSWITGWTIGVALPADQVDGPMRRGLFALGVAALVVVAIGGAFALWIARRVTRTLDAAGEAAVALAKGEVMDVRPSRIEEFDRLSTGLREASSVLDARLRERDAAARTKEEFLMTLSHELRTPLTAIVGWARMLATGQIREGRIRHAAEAIGRNGEALRQLVDDLLDVSRSVVGRMRLEVQLIDLGVVVQSAIETVRPAMEAKAIEIAATIDDEASPIAGDATRLQQVVWNLLANAVRFTPRGGRITVRVHRLLEQVEIVVSDTGPGIDPAFLPYAFDPFRQGGTGPTRTHGGLGLGLAIVRQLTELHGGTVHAENNVGAPGATFTVLLPSLKELPAAAAY